METDLHLFLVNIWLGFLGLFLTFYVVLDGFDLGIGVLSLFVRIEERRGLMVASMSSVWDANETWLVVLGGALFGAFPSVYGVVLHALYLPLTTMIFALVFRGVAFEFRAHGRGRRLWDLCFGFGSTVAALCQGLALGGLIQGLPVRNGEFVGGPFSWLSAFSVLVALGVTFGYMLLGATYMIIKLEGEGQAHARQLAWVSGALMLVAAAGVSIWTPFLHPLVAQRWFGNGIATGFVLPPAFALLCAALLAHSLRQRQEHAPFVWAIGIFLGSMIGLAASFYPFIVPVSMAAPAVSADDMTLVFMMLGIGMLIPVMITYNAYQYIVFRGKIRQTHYG